MAKRYIVTLTDEERRELGRLVSSGQASARKLAHARILLKADSSEGGPAWTDQRISQALDVGVATVERVRQRFVEEGLEAALGRRKPRRQYLRRLDGHAEAHLIALACSQAPEGHARWTLRLLADRMVELGHVDSVSHETVRQTLKKTNSSPGCRSNGASHRRPMRSSSTGWKTSWTSTSVPPIPSGPSCAWMRAPSS